MSIVNMQNGKIDTSMDLNDLFDINEYPVMSFKMTFFEKINKNITFLKVNTMIKNTTNVVELDAASIGIHTSNGE